MGESFIEKMGVAPVGGGFTMEGYWVWCGSVIQGEDGKFHMFASRWPKSIPFTPGWVTNSEVVRAVSQQPEGPYVFEEVVLPARGSEYWDGRMTHNPTIHKHGDTYLLFYIGVTYEEPMPEPGELTAGSIQGNVLSMKARASQRIGLATSNSVYGPWERPDEPILQPKPGEWDSLMTTNPAPCVKADGSVLLIYKSTGNQKDLLRMGVAKAEHWSGTYKRLKNEPIFRFDETGDHIEDGYVWWSDEQHRYEIIMKDMNGGICGEKHAGIFGYSSDGIHWHIANPPKAYSRTIHWSNGETTVQGSLERPQLLIRNGKPTHLFAATADGPGGFHNATKTWNMVIPLR
jgi:hypothetical protein